MSEELREATHAIHAAYVDTTRRMLARAKEAFAPIGEWMNTPEGRAQLAAWHAEHETQECHCMCAVSHNGPPRVCAGPASTTVTRWTEVTGWVKIPMCEPCATAVLEHQRA